MLLTRVCVADFHANGILQFYKVISRSEEVQFMTIFKQNYMNFSEWIYKFLKSNIVSVLKLKLRNVSRNI